MKLLIFEDGGFTTAVLTHLLTDGTPHSATCFRGIQSVDGWIALDQNLQPVAFDPSDYDVAFIDQNLNGAKKFPEVEVEALSKVVPCIGMSSVLLTNAQFQNHGAKLALTKGAIFAGLLAGRLVFEQVKNLTNDDAAALADFETEMLHPTADWSRDLRNQTDKYLGKYLAAAN
jgi:hypothetical protein